MPITLNQNSTYAPYFNKGVDAYNSGLSLLDNPYKCDGCSDEQSIAIAWESGWKYAYENVK